MKTRIVLLCLAMIISAVSPAFGQDSIGVRESLVINEIMPVGSSDQPAWIEAYNPLRRPVPLAGIEIDTGPGQTFRMPDSLPDLEHGAYLTVFFDVEGSGSRVDDTGYPDLVLHAPSWVSEHWRPNGGELLVSRSSDSMSLLPRTALDYVAWGAPGGQWSREIRSGLWPEGGFVPLAEGFGLSESRVTVSSGVSLGIYPNSPSHGPDDWVVFDVGETSPGEVNWVPRPKTFTMTSGAVVGSQSLALGWIPHKGDEEYRLHLALSEDPEHPLAVIETAIPNVRLSVEDVDRDYAVWVTALSASRESKPSSLLQIGVRRSACDLPTFPRFQLQQLIAFCKVHGDCGVIPEIEFKFQRKDTHMLCRHQGCGTERCPQTGPHPFCLTNCTWRSVDFSCMTACADDGSFSRTCEPGGSTSRRLAVRKCDHGNNYCAMASISMIGSAYGACLSQDRISYYEREAAANPTEQLSHELGLYCFGNDGGACTTILKWALGFNDLTPPYFRTHPPEGFQEVKDLIDGGHPIMTLSLSHMRVLAGYCEDTSFPPGSEDRAWVLLYDPWTGPRTQRFDTWKQDSTYTWVAPSVRSWNPRRVRSDEVTVWTNCDGDEYVDFDEKYRLFSPVCGP